MSRPHKDSPKWRTPVYRPPVDIMTILVEAGVTWDGMFHEHFACTELPWGEFHRMLVRLDKEMKFAVLERHINYRARSYTVEDYDGYPEVIYPAGHHQPLGPIFRIAGTYENLRRYYDRPLRATYRRMEIEHPWSLGRTIRYTGIPHTFRDDLPLWDIFVDGLPIGVFISPSSKKTDMTKFDNQIIRPVSFDKPFSKRLAEAPSAE